MRSIKKLAAIAIIGLLAAGIIACGGSDTPDPTNTAAPPTATLRHANPTTHQYTRAHRHAAAHQYARAQ